MKSRLSNHDMSFDDETMQTMNKAFDQVCDVPGSFGKGVTAREMPVRATRGIIQANIDRFKELLKTETDPVKRAMEARLLAEEEVKLKQVAKPDDKDMPALSLKAPMPENNHAPLTRSRTPSIVGAFRETAQRRCPRFVARPSGKFVAAVVVWMVASVACLVGLLLT